MQDRRPLDLAQRPGVLEHVLYVLMVPLVLVEIFACGLAVGLPAVAIVDALSGPGSPEWWAVLVWTVALVVIAGLLYLMLRNQVASKLSNPPYLFQRFFSSRLLVGPDGVELGSGREQRWPWSEIHAFEVRHDTRYAPRAGSWVEVSAVMCLTSGEEVELPALGCFHDRWKKSVAVIQERVIRLNQLLQSAG